MKKVIILISLILAEVVIGIIYGLSPQNKVSTLLFYGLGAVAAFCIFLIFLLKNHRFSEIFIDITVFSLILGLIPFFFSSDINELGGKFVAEHTVTVDKISGRADGTASFYTPDGSYATVDLHDYRIIILDGEEFVDVGDTIKVCEYVGLFKQKYYVFVEEVYQ